MSVIAVQDELTMPFPEVDAEAQDRGRPQRRLLTVLEVAERLNIGRTKVFHLIAAGQLESVRIGRLRRIPVEAVDAYVDELVRDARQVLA